MYQQKNAESARFLKLAHPSGLAAARRRRIPGRSAARTAQPIPPPALGHVGQPRRGGGSGWCCGCAFSGRVWQEELPHGLGLARCAALAQYDQDALDLFKDWARAEDDFARALGATAAGCLPARPVLFWGDGWPCHAQPAWAARRKGRVAGAVGGSGGWKEVGGWGVGTAEGRYRCFSLSPACHSRQRRLILTQTPTLPHQRRVGA
jgi:hypothetical protein